MGFRKDYGKDAVFYGVSSMTKERLLTDNITPAETIVRMMFASMPEHLHTPASVRS